LKPTERRVLAGKDRGQKERVDSELAGPEPEGDKGRGRRANPSAAINLRAGDLKPPEADAEGIPPPLF